jgi:rhodanese-related sulfurtransferase
VLAASKAEFSEVYNIEGGIHAYATQVNPAVGTY